MFLINIMSTQSFDHCPKYLEGLKTIRIWHK
jgi:hypothetical protein